MIADISNLAGDFGAAISESHNLLDVETDLQSSDCKALLPGVFLESSLCLLNDCLRHPRSSIRKLQRANAGLLKVKLGSIIHASSAASQVAYRICVECLHESIAESFDNRLVHL